LGISEILAGFASAVLQRCIIGQRFEMAGERADYERKY
jgi:hypothetical protein